MHPRFAERIAQDLHVKKWKHGWTPAALTKWLADRFPHLTMEDATQIRELLSAKARK